MTNYITIDLVYSNVKKKKMAVFVNAVSFFRWLEEKLDHQKGQERNVIPKTQE